MSRLDYVTIAIVAVCVAALVYLIYMTTSLLGNNDTAENPDEVVAEEQPVYEDTYPEDSLTYDDGYYGDADSLGEETSGYPGETYTDPEDDYDDGVDYEDATDDTDTGYYPSGGSTAGKAEEDYASVSQGQYMVLAGTFKYRSNAEQRVRKLREMGYANASVELFDRGAFAVALVDRYDGLSEAKSLEAELADKGVEAYVKQK